MTSVTVRTAGWMKGTSPIIAVAKRRRLGLVARRSPPGCRAATTAGMKVGGIVAEIPAENDAGGAAMRGDRQQHAAQRVPVERRRLLGVSAAVVAALARKRRPGRSAGPARRDGRQSPSAAAIARKQRQRAQHRRREAVDGQRPRRRRRRNRRPIPSRGSRSRSGIGAASASVTAELDCSTIPAKSSAQAGPTRWRSGWRKAS